MAIYYFVWFEGGLGSDGKVCRLAGVMWWLPLAGTSAGVQLLILVGLSTT